MQMGSREHHKIPFPKERERVRAQKYTLRSANREERTINTMLSLLMNNYPAASVYIYTHGMLRAALYNDTSFSSSSQLSPPCISRIEIRFSPAHKVVHVRALRFEEYIRFTHTRTTYIIIINLGSAEERRREKLVKHHRDKTRGQDTRESPTRR